MYSWYKPTANFVRGFLHDRRLDAFSYSEVGMSRTGAGGRFTIDRTQALLGSGETTFVAAVRAVREWRMFPAEMVELFFPDRPIEVGTLVAALFRAPGFWSLNPARIIYVTDEEVTQAGQTRRQFGFAYGTLPDHLECGEERFLVEWNRTTDEVWYHLAAYSRPHSWLVWCGYPYARWQQARFRRLSCAAMRRAVATLVTEDGLTAKMKSGEA